MIWTAILGVINWLSSATFGKIVSAASTVLVNRSNNDAQKYIAATDAERDVKVEMIHADAAAFHEQMTAASVRWGWWPYRVLVLCVAVPMAWHAGGIYLDSCSFLPWIDWSGGLWQPQLVAHRVGSWRFVAAPGEYADIEFKALATIIGIFTVQSGIAAYLHKK